MSSLADMTGAPVKHEGFELSPLSYDDWGYFENWVKAEIIAQAAETIQTGKFGEAVARITMDSAISRANRIYFLHPECQSFLKTHDGQIVAIYLSMRHTDDKITIDGLTKQFVDDQGLPTRLLNKVTEMTEGPVVKKMDEMAEKKNADAADAALMQNEEQLTAIEASPPTP